jgi:transcriptional repressor NrdR
VRCPFCGDEDHRVIDSRLARERSEIRRRRECNECGRRFTTRERIEEVLPKIVKRDERREEYDRTKLVASIEKPCAKRPVGADVLERMLERLERRLAETGASEVASRTLGEWVLEELVAIDTLAAARFASVFRDFQNAQDYAAFFAAAERKRRDARTG